jgi:8-oxo-dGTP pyrophosphatase MutT (NUDIX family)
MANIVHGVLAIIRRDEHLLMIQRSRFVRAPLAWCFPGGTIEPNEAVEAALVREVREEVGLNVRPARHLMTQTKHAGKLVLYCWSAEIISGELAPHPQEIAEIAWMTPAEVRAKEGVLPGTTDILDHLGL